MLIKLIILYKSTRAKKSLKTKKKYSNRISPGTVAQKKYNICFIEFFPMLIKLIILCKSTRAKKPLKTK